MSKLITALNKISSLEELSEKNTPIHNIHPMIKMITTMVFLVVVISFNKYNISGMIPFFNYPILLMSICEIPFKSLLSRLLIALPFSFLAGLSNLFLDREVAYSLVNIPITWGLISFASIMIKTILTVMAILILIATTPMDKISYQLIRARVPKIFVMQLMLTYRYISVLINETSNMVTAYHLRSKKQKGVKLIHAGPFMGQLLLRSFDKADKVYYAMKCRGFNGEYKLAAVKNAEPKDYFYVIILCGIFITMRFINISYLIGSFFG